MINYISGVLEEINPSMIVVDNNGIGYEVFVPSSILSDLPAIGSQVKVRIHMVVKEDAFELYGFLKIEEIELFRLLLKVNGVGPKGALQIMSEMTVENLRFAVLGDDAKAISKIKGIGPKTAQKIIIELKDKIDFLSAFENSIGTVDAAVKKSSGSSSVKQEVILALTSLGFSASAAAKTLDQMTISDNMTTEQVLNDALKQMSFL